MKKNNSSKYYWYLNDTALKEIPKILRDPKHPKFNERVVAILSRCDRPAELFSIIPKKQFVATWPQIKKYWRKLEPVSTFFHWWQTMYEQILPRSGIRQPVVRGTPMKILVEWGRKIRMARLKKRWSQMELARRVGMGQSIVSRIEVGKVNMTIATAALLAKPLGIKTIELEDQYWADLAHGREAKYSPSTAIPHEQVWSKLLKKKNR